MANEWGPLGALIGEWEGEGGLDSSYSHAQGEVVGTPYLEKVSFKPFGPVDNGNQHLYGLDYKTAMWRATRRTPSTPRSATGCGTGPPARSCAASSSPGGSPSWPAARRRPTPRSFTLKAAVGDTHYAIGEGKYLTDNASSVSTRRPSPWATTAPGRTPRRRCCG